MPDKLFMPTHPSSPFSHAYTRTHHQPDSSPPGLAQWACYIKALAYGSSFILLTVPVIDIVGVIGIMSFLCFVSFCYMADGWRKAEGAKVAKSGVEAAITFSFFSICVFVSMPFC